MATVKLLPWSFDFETIGSVNAEYCKVSEMQDAKEHIHCKWWDFNTFAPYSRQFTIFWQQSWSQLAQRINMTIPSEIVSGVSPKLLIFMTSGKVGLSQKDIGMTFSSISEVVVFIQINKSLSIGWKKDVSLWESSSSCWQNLTTWSNISLSVITRSVILVIFVTVYKTLSTQNDERREIRHENWSVQELVVTYRIWHFGTWGCCGAVKVNECSEKNYELTQVTYFSMTKIWKSGCGLS